MNAADADRDDFHIGIIEQILTTQRHYDLLIKAVGAHMDPLVSAFQGGQARAYDDQTGMMDNFLQELQSDKYKDDVEKLKLSSWIDALKKANDLCASLSSGRTGERTEQVKKQVTAQTRPICDAAYADVVKHLNARCLINGDEKYAELITYWNTRLDHYRTVTSHRLGAGKGGAQVRATSRRPLLPEAEETNAPANCKPGGQKRKSGDGRDLRFFYEAKGHFFPQSLNSLQRS